MSLCFSFWEANFLKRERLLAQKYQFLVVWIGFNYIKGFFLVNLGVLKKNCKLLVSCSFLSSFFAVRVSFKPSWSQLDLFINNLLSLKMVWGAQFEDLFLSNHLRCQNADIDSVWRNLYATWGAIFVDNADKSGSFFRLFDLKRCVLEWECESSTAKILYCSPFCRGIIMLLHGWISINFNLPFFLEIWTVCACWPRIVQLRSG